MNFDPAVLKLYSTYGQVVGKFVPWFYLFVGIVLLTYPFPVYLFTHELSLSFGFIMPWVDPDTTIGYCLNFTYHTFLVYLTIVGFSFTDMTYIVFIFNLYAILEFKWDRSASHRKKRGYSAEEESFESWRKNRRKIDRLFESSHGNCQVNLSSNRIFPKYLINCLIQTLWNAGTSLQIQFLFPDTFVDFPNFSDVICYHGKKLGNWICPRLCIDFSNTRPMHFRTNFDWKGKISLGFQVYKFFLKIILD